MHTNSREGSIVSLYVLPPVPGNELILNFVNAKPLQLHDIIYSSFNFRLLIMLCSIPLLTKHFADNLNVSNKIRLLSYVLNVEITRSSCLSIFIFYFFIYFLCLFHHPFIFLAHQTPIDHISMYSY
jgi:hypothetical protein